LAAYRVILAMSESSIRVRTWMGALERAESKMLSPYLELKKKKRGRQV
jgi:hypothetical protein